MCVQINVLGEIIFLIGIVCNIKGKNNRFTVVHYKTYLKIKVFITITYVVGK